MTKRNIIFFASGRGSNIEAILEYFKDKPYFSPKLVVCNKPNIGAIEVAIRHNIPHLVIDKNTFNTPVFLEQLQAARPDLLILAGFLWKIPESVVNTFPNKIINIHPALLPKYGGKGMYGDKVHQAVITNKEKESGITIHYVNENYDEGNHICQAYCTITPEDNAATLAQKIHKLEHYFFPRTIDFILKGTMM